VTYRVEFHAAALAQLKGLPNEFRIFDVTWVA